MKTKFTEYCLYKEKTTVLIIHCSTEFSKETDKVSIPDQSRIATPNSLSQGQTETEFNPGP